MVLHHASSTPCRSPPWLAGAPRQETARRSNTALPASQLPNRDRLSWLRDWLMTHQGYSMALIAGGLARTHTGSAEKPTAQWPSMVFARRSSVLLGMLSTTTMSSAWWTEIAWVADFAAAAATVTRCHSNMDLSLSLGDRLPCYMPRGPSWRVCTSAASHDAGSGVPDTWVTRAHPRPPSVEPARPHTAIGIHASPATSPSYCGPAVNVVGAAVVSRREPPPKLHTRSTLLPRLAVVQHTPVRAHTCQLCCCCQLQHSLATLQTCPTLSPPACPAAPTRSCRSPAASNTWVRAAG
jgi:hypothetical protein